MIHTCAYSGDSFSTIAGCSVQLQPEILLTAQSGPHEAFAADLNNDTNLDLIVPNYNTGSVSVLLGNGNGSFQGAVNNPTAANPTSVQVGDFNRDGILDVAVACEAGALNILIGLGDGTFSDTFSFSSAAGSLTLIITVDINHDTYLDIVAASADSFNMQIFYGIGDGTFQNSVLVYTISTSGHLYYMTSGYFNNDTELDFAVVISTSSNTSVATFLGATNGTLMVPPSYYSTGSNADSRGICVADVNQDGHVDLVVTNYGLNTLSIFQGDGQGIFQTTPTTVTLGSEQGPYSMVTADFNKDNIPDLVVSFDISQSVMMLFGNGDGSFAVTNTSSTNGAGSSSARYLYVADLNHDGLIDVTLGDYGASKVGVFLTVGGACNTSADCCTGAVCLSDGVCGAPPPTCAARGQPCVTTNDCCRPSRK